MATVKIVHPRVLTDFDIQVIAQRRAYTMREIFQICSGEKRWTMSVPHQDTDSDHVFVTALHDSERLEQEVYRLRGELRKLYIEKCHSDEMSEDVATTILAILFEGKTNNDQSG